MTQTVIVWRGSAIINCLKILLCVSELKMQTPKYISKRIEYKIKMFYKPLRLSKSH